MVQDDQSDEMKKRIKDLARLSKIRLSEDQVAALIPRLATTFSLILSLNDVDCHDVVPLMHPLDITLTLREDIPERNDCCTQLAAMAPLFDDGLYLVPPAISAKEDGSS